MLFSEIYSAYYNTVASIISCSQQGKLDSDTLYEIVNKSAFPESFMTIGSALETGKWPLIKKDYSTNIQNTPTMPLSILQKRWLKALCNDKRIRLFVDDEVLEKLKLHLKDVETLFTENDYYLYDKYSDGDPYDDAEYIKNFRTVIKAIHQKKKISLDYAGRFGQQKRFICEPYKIEYSEKDDKFRIISKVKNHHSILNFARINTCELTEDSMVDEISEEDLPYDRRTSVTLEIYN